MARVAELTMAGGNRRLLLVLALVAGLVAAIIVFAVVQSSGSSSSSSSGPVTAAVVTTKAISAGSTIAEGDLKMADVPNSLLIAGAFTDTAAAVGHVSRVAIAQGEQITADKLGSPSKSADGLNSVVPQGKRGMSVPVEEVTGVGGNLLPGDHVNVLAVFTSPDQASGGLIVSTILQNIEILAVAQEAQRPVAAPTTGATDQTSTSGQLPTNPKTEPDANSVTLAVDPQQAELLAGILQTAKIILTLRSYGDQSITDIAPVPVNQNGGQ